MSCVAAGMTSSFGPPIAAAPARSKRSCSIPGPASFVLVPISASPPTQWSAEHGEVLAAEPLLGDRPARHRDASTRRVEAGLHRHRGGRLYGTFERPPFGRAGRG